MGAWQSPWFSRTGATGIAAITGGSISAGVTGPAILLAKSSIPVIILATTTYNNNGAAVVGTALPLTYASFYAVVPANSIAAGTPAATDIYYATASSTTAITLFNNRLADNLDSLGNPTIPASPTAFVTTGAGSVAGVTASVTLITLTVPAGTLGTTGEFLLYTDVQTTNNANAKAPNFTFGGTAIYNSSLASTPTAQVNGTVSNRGNASVQFVHGTAFGSNSVGHVVTAAAVNTANAVSVVLAGSHGTATDNFVLERYATYTVK